MISVESEQNPFFTANTSISFNWGGVSGKVGKIMTAINTRRHNEKVVDSLQYYMNYLVEGKYRKIDIYKNAPFEFKINKSQGQLLNQPIGIRFTSETEFEIFAEFASGSRQVQRYGDKSKFRVNVPVGMFTKAFRLGDTIQLPFMSGVIVKRDHRQIKPDSEYFVQFIDFDRIVNRYQNRVQIVPFTESFFCIKFVPYR